MTTITQMPPAKLSRDEIERLGQARYDRDIRDTVERTHDGEFIALDIDSGDYCVNPDELTALRGLRQRQPDARIYFARVGAPVVYEIRSLAKPVDAA